MTITLTIPDSAVAAWTAARLNPFNASSGQPPLTIEQLKQLEVDEETARHEAAYKSALRAQMTTVADEIIAAAGGDLVKIGAALQAGRDAALESLAE
jgi:hypothetical protein